MNGLETGHARSADEGPDPELLPNERVEATFQSDLDDDLRFRDLPVILTSERLMALEHRERGVSHWLSWPHHTGLTLSLEERAGLGSIELKAGRKRLAVWRYTFSQARAAASLVASFDRIHADDARRNGSIGPPTSVPPPSGRPLGFGRGSPLLRLLTFTRPHLGAVVLGFVLTLSTTAAGLIPPYLTIPLVDEVLVPLQTSTTETSDSDVGRVAFYLLALGGAAVAAWLLAWGQGFVMARVSERVSSDLRNRSFAHLQKLSLEYFGVKRSGDLISRISSDTDRLCSFLSDTLVDFVTDVLMIVGTAGVLIAIDPALAAATLVSFPPIAWLILRVRGRLTHGFLRGSRAWAEMTNVLTDAISGIRVVKAFSQEPREIARFERANQRVFDVNNRINALWTFFWPMVALLNQAGLLVVWAVGAWQVFHHAVTVGVLTAFVAYIGRFYARLESMSRMLTATQRASASAERLFEILDRQPTVAEPEAPVPLGRVRGEIRVENVSFRYGARQVLDNVTFHVDPGEMVGIVGHTGSGKSTVANLICRFYDPSDGAVLLDGIDLRQLSVTDFRRQIGVVLQDAFLFFGTIADNVAYACPHASPEQILRAARAARAHEFILKLTDGYDSLVGERGQSLSGGERQRVSIARALLMDPKILILDEATSSIDVETERQIQSALETLVRGRTTIAIAHRLGTLRRAQRIVVLSEGRVAEIGSHTDLLACGGEYARLYRAQLEAEKRRPEGPGSSELEDTDEEAAWSVPPLARTDDLSLSLQNGGRVLVRDRNGTDLGTFVPVRSFPLTHPDRHISLLDPRGREFACFDALSTLVPDVRDVLLDALGRREFAPVIERIEKIRVTPTVSEWMVRTDRGETGFAVDGEHNIRDLGSGRYRITDTHGTRYEIPAARRLDSESRRLLRRFT